MPQSHLVDKLQCMIIYSKTNINLILIITTEGIASQSFFSYNRDVEAQNMTKPNQKMIHSKLVNIVQFLPNHS